MSTNGYGSRPLELKRQLWQSIFMLYFFYALYLNCRKNLPLVMKFKYCVINTATAINTVLSYAFKIFIKSCILFLHGQLKIFNVLSCFAS